MSKPDDQFTVIQTSSDGAHMEFLHRDELEKRLNEDYYGSEPKFSGTYAGSVDLQAKSGFWIIPGWPITPTTKVVKVRTVLP